MVPRTRVGAARWLVGLLLTLHAGAAAAQSADTVTTTTILPGAEVSGRISESAIFDLWEFEASAGEEYRVEMTGQEGLAPLVGLRDTSGNVVIASNLLVDGTMVDAEPNDTALLLLEIPADGTYVLVATRAGTSSGTTTGSYVLRLDLLAQPEPTPDNQADVTFRCGDQVMPVAVSITAGDQSELTESVQLTVYGLDGFEPVVRLGTDGSANPCIDTPPSLDRDQVFSITSIDGPDIVIDSQSPALSTEATVDFASGAGPVVMVIGSRSGLTGSLVVVIEGLAIERELDLDTLLVQPGPRARGSTVTVWMLRSGFSRLDPAITLSEGVVCADVGLRTCDETLRGSAVSRSGTIRAPLLTDRLDSAARFDLSPLAGYEVVLSSGNPQTTGSYTLVLYVVLAAEN